MVLYLFQYKKIFIDTRTHTHTHTHTHASMCLELRAIIVVARSAAKVCRRVVLGRPRRRIR
jgi:hypothetical protein